MSNLLPSRRRPPDHRLPPGALLLFLFCGVTLAIAIRMTGYFEPHQTAASVPATGPMPGRVFGAAR